MAAPLEFDEWLEREIEKAASRAANSMYDGPYHRGWLQALESVKRELEDPEQQQSNNKETST